jgi:sec-independent protein translocase protein TatC
MYLLKKVFELREKALPDEEKPFLDHLEDLRIVITRVVITLLISMLICFVYQEDLMNVLRAPAESVISQKQLETMPDGKRHKDITVPTVKEWNEANQVEAIASGLSPEQRAAFFESLAKPNIEFHARSVALLRATKALPEEKQKNFIQSLEVEPAMTRQLLALLESDPDVEQSAGADSRMMSALKPTETFMLSMKLAFFAGIVLAFPLLLMFVLQFILPGLHQNERKILWPAMLIGFGLFLGGVLFAYFFVLPKALFFFYEWSGSLGVSNDWRIGEYITFATQFTLLFGASFELPVVVMVMVKLGILSYETMSRTRAYAILGIFIAAAVITPTPDMMTLFMMAGPMIVLYEMCIWLAWFDRKKGREREAAEEEEMNRRRKEWMLSDQEYAKTYSEAEAEHHVEAPDAAEHEEHHGEDGWHDAYGHFTDPHAHDEDELKELEKAQEPTKPTADSKADE